MALQVVRGAPGAVLRRGRRLRSLLGRYQPMEHGQELLDAQYTSGGWDYLRSLEELPRFGVVSTYCRALANGGSLLEIGAGEGIFLQQLDRRSYARYTGVDVSPVAISRAAALEDERTTFVCADAEHYIPEGPYDAIIYNEVLEYLADPLAVLRSHEPAVAPRGHFIVSMFSSTSSARSHHIWRSLQSRYSPVAHTKISTRRGYTWHIKALAAHPGQ